MKFSVLCFAIALSLVATIPRSHRMQDPLDREISLEPLLNTKTAFTRAALDYYLSILNDYKDYVPKEIKLLFRGLSDSTKNKLVAGVNDIEAGRLVIPNDPERIIAHIKKTPELAQNVEDAIDMLTDDLSKVSQGTRNVFQKWWRRIFTAVSAPRAQVANQIARVISDFKTAYDKASPAIKNDIAKAWPEAYNLLERLKVLLNYAEEL
ncbi:unnamed protein product [Strongylus vulgaris]|uniref:SXP/RAL-2 family protein Ani s 5-like cation-binding domain-containing protein n=1 Tax=Strongylus vulgaris TaxID=40348 RepID=A0A3P7J8A1_STRVU|nr:unnamed protein product [Strongylus vulgaris]